MDSSVSCALSILTLGQFLDVDQSLLSAAAYGHSISSILIALSPISNKIYPSVSLHQMLLFP